MKKNIELNIELDKYIVSSTDKEGIITYVNDYFVEISLYEKEELLGSPHNIIRHPDMPKAIFKLMWISLKKKKNIKVIVKNLTKDGKYYWLIAENEPIINNEKEVIGYISYRRGIKPEYKEEIEKIYNEMIVIEKEEGVQESYLYFMSILLKNKTTYKKFINKLINEKKFFKLFLENMKRKYMKLS